MRQTPELPQVSGYDGEGFLACLGGDQHIVGSYTAFRLEFVPDLCRLQSGTRTKWQSEPLASNA